MVSLLHRSSPPHAHRARSLETVVGKPAGAPPRHDAIAALAYRYWQARGCPIGSPDEDWYRAERFLAAGPDAFPPEKL